MREIIYQCVMFFWVTIGELIFEELKLLWYWIENTK